MQDIIRLDDNRTTWSPIGDIQDPMISHHQTPICKCPSLLSGIHPLVLSLLSRWFIFGYDSCSLSFSFVCSYHAQPICFVSSFHQGCVPHLFIHFLTYPLTSAYSFLSWPHLPLSSADSFVHMTHFGSDLLTNPSHTPYLPLFSYHFLYRQMFPNMGEQ